MTIRVSWCFALLLAIFTTTNDAAKSEIGPKKILVVLPVASHSHHTIVSTLTTALMDRGHFVTIVSSREQKSKHSRLREVIVKEPFGQLLEKVSIAFFGKPSSSIGKAATNFMIAPRFSGVVFDEPKALALMNETFDVVITTPFIYQEPMLAFAHHFGCPSVNLHPMGYTYALNQFTGGATNPAYVPNLHGTSSQPETFFERVENTLTSLMLTLAHEFYYYPKADALMRTVFPDAPPIKELLKNISLTLITNNNAIMHPVPVAPSVIEVGGIHIKPGKPLPADSELKKWMDDSINGFVYFSLGTNLKPSLLPAEKRDAIFASFGKLQQRVLIKWNGDPPPHPKNCRFEEWVPQQEVLAHPNIKVFVTHGGLLSTQESVYSGAPVLGMPIFGDQFLNMETAIKLGIGLQFSIHDFNSEMLDAALHEVINNPKYREKTKELSLRFRLDPTPPLDKAVYYIEQLIKLGSFRHLQPRSVHLPWYQYMLLDVIAVILIALYIAYHMTRLICSSLFGCCFKSSKAKTD